MCKSIVSDTTQSLCVSRIEDITKQPASSAASIRIYLLRGRIYMKTTIIVPKIWASAKPSIPTEALVSLPVFALGKSEEELFTLLGVSSLAELVELIKPAELASPIRCYANSSTSLSLCTATFRSGTSPLLLIVVPSECDDFKR